MENFGRATKARQNGGSLNRYGCLVSLPELLNTEVNCMHPVCSLEVSQKAQLMIKPAFYWQKHAQKTPKQQAYT